MSFTGYHWRRSILESARITLGISNGPLHRRGRQPGKILAHISSCFPHIAQPIQFIHVEIPNSKTQHLWLLRGQPLRSRPHCKR